MTALRIVAEVAIHNTFATEENRSLKRTPDAFNKMFVITLGPERGIMVMNQMVKFGDFGKMKNEISELTMLDMAGDTDAKRQKAK